MIQPDRKIIIQIFGCLMIKPYLLSDIDKYQLEVNDFSTQFDKFIFSAIYNLYQGGAEAIHAVDIDTYLQSNSLAKQTMEKENGIGFLQDCETYCEIENFNYYYQKLKKINLLRDLQKSGRDISEFYSENPLDENYNKINDKFEKTTTEEIINSLKGELAAFENKYVLNSVVEESNAYDGIKDLIVDLKEAPEIGCPLQGDIFNTIIRGGRKGKLYLRSASSGLGKAIPNSFKLPTPNGWKTIGDIKEGDYVFDGLGKPTKVLKIFPQGLKDVYKVIFKDGRVALCNDEHLWSYNTETQRKKSIQNRCFYTNTLKEIEEKGLKTKDGAYNIKVPMQKAVEYKEREHYIPSYVFGLMLGNEEFKEEQQKGEKINVWVEDILKEYPELINTTSQTKFIPRDYIEDSINNRFDILNGLLDTDGYITDKGSIFYYTTSSSLRDNFIEIAQSLGFKTSYYIDNPKNTNVCYIIHLTGTPEDKLKLFKLERKHQKVENWYNSRKKKETNSGNPIVKIENLHYQEEMTCFYVDNEEHLFLIGDFIVTHNTRSMVGDACNIAYPIRYEPCYGKWVATGHCEKVLYVMTEQDPAEIQTMILAYLTGYNEDMFLYGTYEECHMDRINKAIKIMETYKDNMMFARIPDPCASVVKNLFRKYNFQYGVENFFYDYIFSSPAMLDEYRDLKLAEHVCLRLFTTALKNLAVELNAFILTSTQISDDDGDGFRDYKKIRGQLWARIYLFLYKGLIFN